MEEHFSPKMSIKERDRMRMILAPFSEKMVYRFMFLMSMNGVLLFVYGLVCVYFSKDLSLENAFTDEHFLVMLFGLISFMVWFPWFLVSIICRYLLCGDKSSE